MKAPQFFTTTIVHDKDHSLRWHFVAAPTGLIQESDPFEYSPEVIVPRSSLPFVIASMILTNDWVGPVHSEHLASELETRFKLFPQPDGYEPREQRALELAESVIFDSRIAFDKYQYIEPLSLINPEHSKISLKDFEGHRFLMIQGPRGFLIGTSGPISTIQEIWEKLIDWM